MGLGRARHRRRARGRIEQQCGKALLFFHRQADDLRLLNRAPRRFLRSPDEEVTEAAPFDLRRAADHCQHVGRNARFDAFGSLDTADMTGLPSANVYGLHGTSRRGR